MVENHRVNKDEDFVHHETQDNSTQKNIRQMVLLGILFSSELIINLTHPQLLSWPN